MKFLDIYNWPKHFVEDSISSENNELENIFVDDYIAKVLNMNLENCNELELDELLRKSSLLASFFSRLRITVNQILGNMVLERLLDEADREAEGFSDLGSRNPFVKVENKDLPNKLKKFLEEE